MSTSLLLGFALGWIGSMPIAGAVSIFIVHHGLAGRVRDGLRLAAGAGIAEALWCTAVRLGAGRLFEHWPVLKSVAETGGGVILVGLGLYFLLRRPKSPAAAPTESARSGGNFRLGFALVAGNVAVPVNWLALLAIMHSLGLDPYAASSGAFSSGVALGIFGWFTFLLVTLDFFRGRFAPRTLGLVGKGMGALLVATGLVVLARQAG